MMELKMSMEKLLFEGTIICPLKTVIYQYTKSTVSLEKWKSRQHQKDKHTFISDTFS